MKIRIGIITKNRATILPKAIDSVLLQDYKNIEIAIFDDASTDSTPAIQADYPNLRWYHSPTSIGYRSARNQMMTDTDADFFCSLDDDAWFLEKDALSIAVEHFAKNPTTGAIAFDILEPTHPHKHTRGAPIPKNTYVGCGHLLRLSLLSDRVGHYQEFPGRYGTEEKDLSLRLLDVGYDVILLPGVHVWHDKSFHARDIADQHRSGVSNDIAFLLLRCPFPLLLYALPQKLLGHLLFCFTFGLRTPDRLSGFEKEIIDQIGRFGFFRPMFQGIADVVKQLSKLLAARQPVRPQSFRTYIARSRNQPPEISTDE